MLNLYQAQRKLPERLDARVFLLAGTSSAGKTSTSRKLRQALGQFDENAVILAYDDFVDKYEEAFVQHLNSSLVKKGYAKGLESHHDILAQEMTQTERLVKIEAFEIAVSRIGTPWMQQKLAQEAAAHLKRGDSVIIDTLNTHDIIERLGALDIHCPMANYLLMVPFDEYVARVNLRNQEALGQAHLHKDKSHTQNCRDPFDLIEQYGRFFEFKPAEPSNNTISFETIKCILEQAFDGYIALEKSMLALKKVIKPTWEKYQSKMLAVDVEAKQKDLLVSRLIKRLLGEDTQTHYSLIPKQSYDLVVNTNHVNKEGIGNYLLEATKAKTSYKPKINA